MFKVRKLNFNSNKGSATVELCFVLPVVLWICVNIIFLFLDVIGDGRTQGDGYTAIYTYTDDQMRLEGKFHHKVVVVDHSLLCQSRQNSGAGTGYFYEGSSTAYKTEYDLCTERLRRWQLYGDVLRE